VVKLYLASAKEIGRYIGPLLDLTTKVSTLESSRLESSSPSRVKEHFKGDLSKILLCYTKYLHVQK
jgi:hypothetical protein